ncbi:MAG: endonuclease MutS2 [Bacilli bacterium]|nr:endonuclease MutS2 [Bacilli bacterium]
MQDAYQVLEFDKIREGLASYCRGARAKGNALNLHPIGPERLQKELVFLDEASTLIVSYGRMPLDLSEDLEQPIRIAGKGSCLTIEQLDHIATLVSCGEAVRRFIKTAEGRPTLHEYAEDIPDLSFLEQEIHRVITPDLSIYDNASPALRKIRSAITRLERDIANKIGAVLDQNSEFLSDHTLALRNGHYVLPVANAYKSKVKGIVQDISNTGGTTFIEPEVIVSMNNKMVELKNDEREEIHRLLLELSQKCGGSQDKLLLLNSKLSYLDLLQGKCLYGESMHGHIAQFSPDGSLYLPAARHPLLQKDKIIPNDFSLTASKRIVIISGPNAGGKTVALKTLAICSLMFECGLILPTGQGAELPYFKHIFLDIGDSQSLSDNLSTFSAHVKNIGEIVSRIGGKDLVLFDELGTGTSPKEGEALATAIIAYLLKKHCYAVVSSHFEGLKAYALSKEGLVNASMLFDSERLLPTYVLQMGLPGESYGLSVARRFGLDEEIVSNAEKSLNADTDLSVASAIDKLSELTKQNADLKAELERRQNALDTLEKQLKSKEKLISQREEKLLLEADEEKKKILEEAEKRIDEIIFEINHPGAKLHEAIAAKKKLNDLQTSSARTESFSGEVKEGDYVSIPAYGVEGKITRVKGNSILISTSSGMTFNSTKDKVVKIAEPEDKIVPMKGALVDKVGTGPSLSLELNLIGMRVDEALLEIDHYLDQCRLKGFKRVRIIHGFGSGALRKATENYLKTHKQFVQSFEMAGEYEGGGGATVVYLK